MSVFHEHRALLLPYQQRVLNDRTPLVLVAKSRRIGITWALAALAVLTGASPATHGGMDCWYVVGSEADAREFIEDCGRWARALGLMCDDPTRELIEDEDRDLLAFVIRFASGFKVYALSSNPRRLRGKQGLAILDEAAHASDIDAFLKAAMAFVMWGGRVIVVSTHHGEANRFNQLLQEIADGKRGDASAHVITLDDALADGFGVRVAARLGVEWSPEWQAKWRQEVIDLYGDFADEELFCIPSTEGAVFLSRATIKGASVEGRPIVRLKFGADFQHKPEPERRAHVDGWIRTQLQPLRELLDTRGNHFVGVDFGRVSDLSVFAPVEVLEGSAAVPFLVELQNVPLRQQEQIADAVLAMMPRLVAARFDATGNGFALAEHCRDTWGSVVEPVKLAAQWGLEVWPPLRGALSGGTLTIPADDAVTADLLSVRMVNGTPQLARASAKIKGQSRHGDAAVAIGLGYGASMGREPVYDYRAEDTESDYGEIL